MDYASAVAFEVRQPSDGSEPVIRFNFKNGTADVATYDFLNRTGDVPLSVFIDAVAVSLVRRSVWLALTDGSRTLHGRASLLR